MNKTPMKASDPNDLERRILDPNIAKSEAEWWAKSRIEELEHEVAELKQQPTVPTGEGPKTWWELALHVGAWKDHELDYVHFGSEMAVRAFAIHLLRQRDEFEAGLVQERDQLREQVTLLRDVVGHVAGMRFSIVTTKMCEAALATTEPKP